MAEAVTHKDAASREITAPEALDAGEVLQLANGDAGWNSGHAKASGDQATMNRQNLARVAKTSGIVILDGGEVGWDISENKAILPVLTTAEDFILGRAWGDAASADTTMLVEINSRARPYIELQRDSFDHAPVLTAGTPVGSMQGGCYRAAFSATAEAQKLDLLSKKSFAIDSDWIIEAIVEVVTNADADVGDLNVGAANGTHASDADSITESVFAHFDMGADLNLDAESDDGTTEVAATDTTVDWAVGTPVHIAIDGRDETDIQIYVNGVLVLAATTFTLGAGTGPLKALFHLEKSSNDSPGEVQLDKFEVRIASAASV